MKIEEHRAKAERIERSVDRLSPQDFEMAIEAAMLAGTHWLNVILHAKGLRATENDAMHAEFISAAERRKLVVLIPAALGALDAIEAMRATHVRGDMPDGEAAGRRAHAHLAELRRAALAALV